LKVVPVVSKLLKLPVSAPDHFLAEDENFLSDQIAAPLYRHQNQGPLPVEDEALG
jgi:hypothetical protein